MNEDTYRTQNAPAVLAYHCISRGYCMCWQTYKKKCHLRVFCARSVLGNRTGMCLVPYLPEYKIGIFPCCIICKSRGYIVRRVYGK